MVIRKERLFKKLISMAASIFVLFLFLTAGQCPSGTGTTLENPIALEPTADGIAMWHDYADPNPYFFNRYTTDEYFVIGSDSNTGWPHQPGCCVGSPLYFVSLLRFDQAAIAGRNVQQAYLYLYGFDDPGDTGTSLDENLKVDKIATEWDFASDFYDTVSLPGFVTGDFAELPATITPGAGTAYAIDVTAIVQDWATNGDNYGFRLMANQTPADEKRVRFRSSRFSGDETEKPYLAIEFAE